MTLVILIIVIALIFDFLNGFHDSANSIATVVSTRVLKPFQAVLMAAVANFSAFFFFSTAVASTIGTGIIEPLGISSEVILAGLLGACIWNIITWYFGLPVSSSHALIGGLVGAAVTRAGIDVLIFSGLNTIFLFIVLAPLIGMIGALIFTFVVTLFVRNGSRDTLSKVFAKLQIASSFWYSMGHGANDAQKTMGVIALTLFSNGLLGDTFYVPLWVVLVSYAALGIGTYFGGWRIVKTMGSKIIPLRPFQVFVPKHQVLLRFFSVLILVFLSRRRMLLPEALWVLVPQKIISR